MTPIRSTVKFDPANWYWIVGGSTSQVYSTTFASYVSVTDATYLTWLSANPSHQPSRVATEQQLWDYLHGRVGAGTPDTASSTEAAKTERLQEQIKDAIYQLGLDHENRLRAVEGQLPVSQAELLVNIKTMMK
jgi:hypothetical protein